MFDGVFPLPHRVLFTLSRGTYGGPFLLSVSGLAYNNTQRVHPGHRRSQKLRLGAAILFSSCLHFFPFTKFKSPNMSRGGTRVYFGKIPRDTRERDLERFVRGFGRVREVSIKAGYGFVVSAEIQAIEHLQSYCRSFELYFRFPLARNLMIQETQMIVYMI